MSNTEAGPRVLAVDDDSGVLSIYNELLTNNGYGITKCTLSEQVLPIVKENGFDAVLLDIRMPGIEGTDLLPLIKKLRPDLPIILVSSYCNGSDTGYYHELGAFDVIGKPFSHERLLDSLARAVDKSEHIPFILHSLSLSDAKDQVYRKLIVSALRKTNWNQVKAAKLLGISRYCLIRWIKKLGINLS